MPVSGFYDVNGAYNDPGRIDGVAQGIYEASSTQNGVLGATRKLGERVYKYAHFVANANRGVIVAQDISVSGFGPIDGKATAAAIGATQVTLTDTDTFSTADAADVYAGGYLFTEDDAGEGHVYGISSNTQGTAAGVVTLDLFDGLEVALTTDSDVAVVGNMYKNLTPASTTDALVAGVTPITFTAGQYGWVQTWGPANVLTEVTAGKAAAGIPAFLDDGGSGAAGSIAGVASNTTFNAGDVDTPMIGYFMYTGTDAAHTGVYLQIAAV